MNTDQRLAFLRSSKLFAETPPEVVRLIADQLVYETFEPGARIVEKGGRADRMYLVVSGTAQVHEGERLIRVLGPGDGFGEMALLDDQPRAATITAQGPCTLLSLGRAAFDQLISSRLEVARSLLLVLTSNVRSNTETMVEDFSVRIELEQRVQAQLRELAEGQLAVIFALSKLAESRDTDTGLHLERVREYCRLLADELSGHPAFAGQITPEFVELVYRASPLHDIGKVAIPDAILRKPGKLTPEEYEVMKTHASLGAQTLRDVFRLYPQNQFVRVGIDIAESHHEKWDGSGYPAGKGGTEIPLAARIVALADVYDALTSRRPYKEPLSVQATRQMIVEGRGTHFDPAMIDAFLTVEAKFIIVATTMANPSSS